MNKRVCFLILTLLACFTFDLRAFPLSITRLSADDAGILSGIVTETDGVTPIEGARVALFRYPPSFIPLQETYTDTAGVYSFTVESATYCVNASKEGFGFVREYYKDTLDNQLCWPITVNTGATTSNIHIALDRYGTISGTVFRTDGVTRIAGGWLEVFDSRGYWYSLSTDGNGDYTQEVVPGSYKVRARYTGMYDEYYNQQTSHSTANLVSVSSDQDVTGINFTLDDVTIISGRVTLADGITPVVNAHVQQCQPVTSPPAGYIYCPGAYTDADGYYQFEGSRGLSIILAMANGFAPEYYNEQSSSAAAVIFDVVPNDSLPNINFTLGAPAQISGTVIDESMNPFSNFSVLALDPVTYVTIEWAVADVNGFYLLDALGANSYLLRAQRNPNDLTEYYDGHYNAAAADLVSATAGALTPNINFTIGPAAGASGTLGMQGHPGVVWRGPITVTFERVDGGEMPSHATITVYENGQWGIGGLPPGEYRIRAKQVHTLANAVTVTLVPGSNPVDLGTLREGDANNDNVVNISDFSILAAAFGREFWHPAFDARANFNDDNIVNIADFSLLATNFGQVGAP